MAAEFLFTKDGLDCSGLGQYAFNIAFNKCPIFEPDVAGLVENLCWTVGSNFNEKEIEAIIPSLGLCKRTVHIEWRFRDEWYYYEYVIEIPSENILIEEIPDTASLAAKEMNEHSSSEGFPPDKARRELSPSSTRVKKPREIKPLTFWQAFFLLLFVLVIACFLSLGFSLIGLGVLIGASYAVGSRELSLIPFFFVFSIMVILVPYVLGRMVGRWGGFMGLGYSILLIFAIIPLILLKPLNHYIWFMLVPGNSPPYWWIPVFIIPSVIVSSIACHVPGYRSKGVARVFPMNLEKPFASSIFVLVTALLLSGLVPSFALLNVVPERVVRYEDFNIQILCLRGWEAYSYEDKVPYEALYTTTAVKRIVLHPPENSGYSWKNPGFVAILIYDKMPFAGTPLSDYHSTQEVYDSLRAVLEDVKKRPKAYFESPMDADYKWYGSTSVDGQPAVEIKYKTFEHTMGTDMEPLPLSTSTPDIVVHKAPYLYWFEFNETKQKDYQKIVDGINFI